jgi:hypothetical protein
MDPPPAHELGDFSSCFGAQQPCANFLWEQQSYENTDAYAPPPSGSLKMYTFLNIKHSKNA